MSRKFLSHITPKSCKHPPVIAFFFLLNFNTAIDLFIYSSGPLKDFGRGENLEIHDSSTRVDAKTNYTENYNRTSNDSNTNSTAASVDVQPRLMEDILIANSTPPGKLIFIQTSMKRV